MLRIDGIGNIFARRAGSDDSLPPVVMGSHLDTQPTGGRYDGVLGVLGALVSMIFRQTQADQTATENTGKALDAIKAAQESPAAPKPDAILKPGETAQAAGD